MQIDRKHTALLVIDVLEGTDSDSVYRPTPDEQTMNENCVKVMWVKGIIQARPAM